MQGNKIFLLSYFYCRYITPVETPRDLEDMQFVFTTPLSSPNKRNSDTPDQLAGMYIIYKKSSFSFYCYLCQVMTTSGSIKRYLL